MRTAVDLPEGRENISVLFSQQLSNTYQAILKYIMTW